MPRSDLDPTAGLGGRAGDRARRLDRVGAEAKDWRKTARRSARALSFAPLVALALAPGAVFFRAVTVALALWHAYWVWRLTANEVPSATLRLGQWRWVLRALALAGVVLVTLHYEGYRALLIATVAAYLAYLSELSPALKLSSRRVLRRAALGAAVCCALVTGELALRRWVSWADWGTAPGAYLSALAVPFGLLAWLEVARVRAPGLEAKPNVGPAAFRSIRDWAPWVREVVIPFSVAFSLGLAFVLVSFIGGFWFALDYAGLDPGVVRSAALFCLLCLNGSLLLVLRKRRRQTLRRAILGVGLAHIPFWWFLVFPTQFDAGAWNRSPVGSEARSDMAEDLIYSRVLLGKTRAEVVQLVGASSEGRYYGSPADAEFYSLGGRPCKGFVIWFDGERVDRAQFWFCD